MIIFAKFYIGLIMGMVIMGGGILLVHLLFWRNKKKNKDKIHVFSEKEKEVIKITSKTHTVPTFPTLWANELMKQKEAQLMEAIKDNLGKKGNNMKNESHDSIFIRNVQRGIDKGIITVTDDNAKITYHCKRDYSTSFRNPEEKVRASYFTELVLDYNYPIKNIDVEVVLLHQKWE